MNQTLPQVIFLAGVGRSGTTTLSRLIGSCPSVTNVGEFARKLVGADRTIPCGCGQPLISCSFWGPLLAAGTVHRSENVARLGRLRHFPRLLRALRDHGRADWKLIGAADELAAQVRLLWSHVGSRYLLDSSKHPAVAALLVLSQQLHVHIVHVIRRPIAVMESWASPKSYLNRRAPLAALADWVIANRATEALAPFATSYTQLRWEAFLETPKAELDRVIGRVSPSLAAPDSSTDGREFEVGLDHIVAGNPGKLDHSPLRIQATKNDDSSRGVVERLLVTSIASRMLRRYGYVRAGR